jgi:geranylgeranyl pyrophosphate synthase/pimeloyl-ACP methyl ester carboxylesterase
METKTLTTQDGMRLTYYVAGKGDQTLFIANVPGLNIRFWFPIMEQLSKKYRLIGFEYRGFPENKKLLSQVQMEVDRIVEDVEAIMDAEVVQKVHWLSWCAGLLIPQIFIERHPGRTQSMVMLSTPLGHPRMNYKPPKGDFYGNLSIIQKMVEEAPEVAERICKMMRELGSIPSTKFFQSIQPNDPKLKSVIEIMDILEQESSMSQLAFYQIDTPIGLRNYLNLSTSFSIQNDGGNSWMNYPILLLNGENDGFLHRPILGELDWYIRIKECVIPHSSHFLVIERPEIVSNYIERWIDSGHVSVLSQKKPVGLNLNVITKGNYNAWRTELNYLIYKEIKGFLEQTKLSPRLRKLTQRTVSEYICPTLLSCTHSLVLTHYAVTGKWKPAVPIAAVCTLIWAGAHCFDDLNDGDLSTQWEPDHASADATITSFTFATILTQERLRTIRMPAKRYRKVQEIISQGILNLLGGQLEDLHATGDYESSFESVEASVMHREPWGFFNRLGAEFAGAKPEVVDAYGVYGDYLGLSGSLVKDHYELHHDPKQRDLKNGTCTLYLALYLAQMSPEERSGFTETLHLARNDDKARSAVEEKLRQGRFLHRYNSVLKQYRAKSLEALEIAQPNPGPIREILEGDIFQPTYK